MQRNMQGIEEQERASKIHRTISIRIRWITKHSLENEKGASPTLLESMGVEERKERRETEKR